MLGSAERSREGAAASLLLLVPGASRSTSIPCVSLALERKGFGGELAEPPT